MSPLSMGVLELDNTALNHEHKSILCDFTTPGLREGSARYSTESIFYYFNDYTIEILRSPGDLFLKMGNFETVCQELKKIVLSAFEKAEVDSEKYVPRHTLVKNAVWVDWLIVARKNNVPIAFSSATILNSKLIYLNSAMVVSEFQTTRIGAIINPLLWNTINESMDFFNRSEVRFICRTHNRNVISGLMHAFDEVKISTENDLDRCTIQILKNTIEYLKCNYDNKTGISRDVYPEGLPAGKKTSHSRVNDAFEKVGPCDGCYMIGRLNVKYVAKVLGHFKTDIKKVGADFTERLCA